MVLSIKKEVAQQIVEAVKDVCSHDINFIDTKGIIFASTNKKRIGDFHEIGLQVIKTGETLEVSTDNSFLGTQKGVNIPFIYKGVISAVIGISGEPDELKKYAYLAQKITTLLLREHELELHAHNQKTQLTHVIRSLIFHDYINPDYLREFLKKYNTSLNTCYRTVAVRLDSRYNPSNLSMIEQYIFRAFEFTGSSLYTFIYPNEYILFLEADKFQKWLYVFQQLGEKQSPLIKIGIGNAVPLSQQHISYQSAKIAVNSLFLNESLAVFDSLDLEILFGSVPLNNQTFFLEKTLDKLSEKDQTLLKTYFLTNMSLKETAEQLFLHKNTLQYQLDKIWRNTGYNPREFKDATVLYVALKLVRYNSEDNDDRKVTESVPD